MLERWILAAATLFWVTMNILLWRAEVDASSQGGSPVSADVVLQKVLTAPDPSTLELRHQGRHVGYCHWYPDAGEEPSAQTVFASEFVPEGMVRAPHGYTLKLEGNFQLEELNARPRFSAELRLSTNRTWQEFSLNVSLRPTSIYLRADAARQKLEWRYHDGETTRSNSVHFAQLQDPRTWLESVGGPWAALAQAAPPIDRTAGAEGLRLGLEWQAHHHWIRIGNSHLRGYRLEARLLGRHQVVLVVNRVGEIMRVELPNGFLLVNDTLNSL